MCSTLFLIIGLSLPVTMAPEPDSARQTGVTKYVAFLSSLDNHNLDSISQGLRAYKAQAAQFNQAQRDTACREYITFFHATISLHNDNIWEDLDFISKLHNPDRHRDPEVTAFLQALKRNGLALYNFGRLHYIDQREDYLYHHFFWYVSPSFRDYLALRKDELAEGFSNNDALLISFDEVGRRVIRWETYLERYPNSVATALAKYYYGLYLNTFLTGLKNSPVFARTGEIQPHLITTYDTFASRFGSTAAGRLVRQFYYILIEADFRWSPRVRDFYIEHNIANMHQAQIPYR